LKIVRSISEFPTDHNIGTGFVPTMGAIHEGHLSLIQRSKIENDRTVVSIFVNPTQFGPNEDFNKYPRPFEVDCELAKSAGADIIFAPEAAEMYGTNPSLIHVPLVSDLFDGKSRPGHFDGVATIVAKLFNIVSPKIAYFGEKDLQQCAVVKKLVSDFNFPINIIVCETLRESSGLAKSSRNIYLSESEIQIAPLIYATLCEAKTAILAARSSSEVQRESIDFLERKSFEVNYFELVDRLTMYPVIKPSSHASLIVAAKLGRTRLIDNIRVIG
jgi:pantoate--beta-alanine ligase